MKNSCVFIFLIIVLMTSVQTQVCKSSIPFAIDRSLALSSQQFQMQNNFVVNTFLNLFPIDIKPNKYASFSIGASVYTPNNVSDIAYSINSTSNFQDHYIDSFFFSAVSDLLYYGVLLISSAAGLPQNLVVFTGGSFHDYYFNDVQNYIQNLTMNGNIVIVVFVKPNMNETNYKRIPELKLVEWSNDSAVLLANIRKNMNCFGGSSMAPTMTTTFPSASSCKSHIPFAYDVSKSLTSDQYKFEEQLILNPFLSTLFPTNVLPSWFGIFDTSAYFPKSRPNNVSEIVNFVNRYPQLSGKTGNLDVILKQLLARDIFSDNDGLPVNTVIFSGSELPSANVENTIHLVTSFTNLGNTLTIVFTKPNINQNNYNAVALVSNLVLVQYNEDKNQMINNLFQTMNCV